MTLPVEELAALVSRLTQIDQFEVNLLTRFSNDKSNYRLPGSMETERNHLLSQLHETKHPYLEQRKQRFGSIRAKRTGSKVDPFAAKQ